MIPNLAAARSYPYEVPDGFNLVLASTGVQLYRKNYTKGNPDFVQIIDLSQGATIEMLQGDIIDPREGKGSYGGPDARLLSRSLPEFWENYAANHPSAFCVTNGQFFYIKEYPTRLPFPLKKSGMLLTDGYGINEFPGQKLLLELWSDQMDIIPLTDTALYQSSAPDILGGLTEEARKSPDRAVGRTFLGISDENKNGTYESLMIFNTKSATQKNAAEVLRSFGAEKIMMLDGGGSTQLICKGKSLIESERLIPQAIGVAAGMSLVPEPTVTPTATPTPVPIPTYTNVVPTITTEALTQNPSPTTVARFGEEGKTPLPPMSSTIMLGDVLWVPVILVLVAPIIFFVIKRAQSR